MREDEDAAAFVDQFRQHRHQQVEFGALLHLAGGVGLDQPRVAADLTQLEQGVEDDNLAPRKTLAGDLVTDLGVHRCTHGLIEVTLATFQLDAADDDGLWRQFLRDVFFLAAQDERPDAAGEQFAAARVGLLLDRCPPEAGELLAAAEEAGEQEVELAPQFAEVVLQRRTGQAQAVACIDLANCFCALALGILDRLRFVENEQVVAVLHQFFGIAPEQWVGGEYHVVLGNFGKTRLAFRPVQRKDRQRRCEAGRLGLPIKDQRSRQDDQRRLVEAASFLFDQQVG